MIVIDGSHGEGGGQILRTSLALSLLTGTPFQLINVRQNRDKPGLRPQHLVAVRAAAQLGAAVVEGDEVGARQLSFRPTAAAVAGDYRFDIGTAGSAPLVLQTVLPVLLAASEPSTVTIVGGTYNPKAPPYDYLERVYVPLLSRMGPRVTLSQDRPGFYPAGGGQVRARIEPSGKLQRLELLERGAVLSRRAEVLIAGLPAHIAERELQTLSAALHWPAADLGVRQLRARSSGNVVLAEVRCEHVTELFSAVGERGVRAEEVADTVAREVQEYEATDAPVGSHLADQLLLLLGIGSGGVLRTLPPTMHTLTQMDIMKRFLNLHITSQPEPSQKPSPKSSQNAQQVHRIAVEPA